MGRFKLQRMEVCPVGPEYNTAEWLTRGRTPYELNKGSHWWKGPPIWCQSLDDWGSNLGCRKKSRFQKNICSTTAVTVQPTFTHYERFSDINRVIWVVARLKNIARSKTFRAGNAMQITTQHLKEAEDFFVKDIQKSIEGELKTSSNKGGKRGHCAKLRPVLDVNGMWVVDERPTRYNAMKPD